MQLFKWFRGCLCGGGGVMSVSVVVSFCSSSLVWGEGRGQVVLSSFCL